MARVSAFGWATTVLTVIDGSGGGAGDMGMCSDSLVSSSMPLLLRLPPASWPPLPLTPLLDLLAGDAATAAPGSSPLSAASRPEPPRPPPTWERRPAYSLGVDTANDVIEAAAAPGDAKGERNKARDTL